MEFLRAFAPMLIFIVIIVVLMWVFLTWYFGFSWL